jgi:hypothetical protein
MMPRMHRHTTRAITLPSLLAVLALAASACSGGGSTSPDGASAGGMCSADVPAGQACNAVANVGTLISPTCITGTVATGTGGAMTDGSYVLTAQTYYNVPTCPPVQISGTIEVAGDCIQLAFGGAATGTTSVRFDPQGTGIMSNPTCINFTPSGPTANPDAPNSKTFTVSGATLTMFTRNSGTGNTNPDRIEVFTRR